MRLGLLRSPAPDKTSTTILERRGDAGDGRIDFLMFPNADDTPALLAKPCIRVPVTLPVAFKLRAPPVAILPRPRCVVGAHVPEATVYEHGDTTRYEDHVRSAPRTRKAIVDAESIAGPMQSGA